MFKAIAKGAIAANKLSKLKKQGDVGYEGERDADFNKSGFGTLTLLNGEMYVGHWKNNMRHGQGNDSLVH